MFVIKLNIFLCVCVCVCVCVWGGGGGYCIHILKFKRFGIGRIF